MRSLSTGIRLVTLNISSDEVVHPRLIVCSLGNIVHFSAARISSYYRIVGKFDNLELQRLGVRDDQGLSIIQSILSNFVFSQRDILILAFSDLDRVYYIIDLKIVFVFILQQVFDIYFLLIDVGFILVQFGISEYRLQFHESLKGQ